MVAYETYITFMSFHKRFVATTKDKDVYRPVEFSIHCIFKAPPEWLWIVKAVNYSDTKSLYV